MLASTSTVRRFSTLFQTMRRKKDRIRTSGNIFLLRNAAAAAVEGWREEGGGGDIGMSQLSCGWNPRLGGSDITRTVAVQVQ